MTSTPYLQYQSTSTGIKWSVTESSSSTINISYNDNSYYKSYVEFEKKFLTKSNVLETSILDDVENDMTDYIYSNFNRETIEELGCYIYQHIINKTMDTVEEWFKDNKKDYYITTNIEDLIKIVCDAINYDSLFDLVDYIENAPVTFEEKLAEVGMSIHDFI